MKKIFNLALTALLAVGIVSCSEDVDNVMNPENQTNGKLTFVLPYASGVTTYAGYEGDVPASEAEKEIVLANTKVYMFKADNTLEKVLAPTAGSPVGGKATATIDVDEAWTGSKTFIMVANTDKAATDLATVTEGMDQDDFMDLLTDSKGKTQIECPLLMAGIESVTDIQAESSVTMKLARSVARFDINNNVTNNKVTIKNIYVTNANRNGYIMGYERSSLEMNTSVEIAANVDKGDLDAVAAPAAVAGVQAKEAAFYLHPTVVGKNATGTVITLEVEEDGGTIAFYTVHKFDATGTTKEDITVEANHRYIISSKINPVTGKLMFIMVPAEWDEGNDVIGVPGTGSAFGVVTPQAGDITNGTFNATYNSIAVTTPASAFEAKLAVKGTSTKGVTAQVLAQTGTGLIEVNGDIIKVTDPVTDGSITYAAPYFTYTFTVSFEADKIATDKNFTTIVRLTDVASGATTDVAVHYGSMIIVDKNGVEVEIVVMYPIGAGYGYMPAIEVGGIIWAPVNVGATKIDGSTASFEAYGYVYQFGRTDFATMVKAGGNGTLTGDEIEGPVTYQSAITGGENAGKFIYPGSGYDYLESTDIDFDLRNSLWANGGSPCPEGWRMPIKAEWEVIVSKYVAENFAQGVTNLLSIPGDVEGETLYLPAGGFRKGVDGTTQYRSTQGQYWSCELSDIELNGTAYGFNFNVTSAKTVASAKANAMSVRCVKDVI